MQVKLLRAIQERAVRPIGTQTEIPTDVRILSATHKELGQLVETGAFRQDLFYRLNVIDLRMPSLRERAEDIAELSEFILDKLGKHLNLESPSLTSDAMAALQEYAFPGNIRELENILERAFTLCEGNSICAFDLLLPEQPLVAPAVAASQQPNNTASVVPFRREPSPAPLSPTEAGLENYLEELEKAAITKALESTRYNKTAAAEKLGISFRALRYRLKKLGLD
jgi:two-component system response regulator PilR (NtrC family)